MTMSKLTPDEARFLIAVVAKLDVAGCDALTEAIAIRKMELTDDTAAMVREQRVNPFRALPRSDTERSPTGMAIADLVQEQKAEERRALAAARNGRVQ
jgi:hypothetical protein